jgi:hypothetical protein
MKSLRVLRKLIVPFLVIFLLFGCASSPTDGDPKPTDNDPKPSEETKDVYAAYDTTFSAGYYTAGIDFPAGKYDLAAQSGMGNVICLESLPLGLNVLMGKPIQAGFTIETYNNADFKKGDVLSITSTLVLKISSKKALTSGIMKRSNTASVTVNLAAGNYTAGTDFKEGTYNIVAISGMGNVISIDSLLGGINAIMGNPVQAGFTIKEYKNVSFEKGYTLTITSLKVQLVPSK